LGLGTIQNLKYEEEKNWHVCVTPNSSLGVLAVRLLASAAADVPVVSVPAAYAAVVDVFAALLLLASQNLPAYLLRQKL
jgi:hypothetical protein